MKIVKTILLKIISYLKSEPEKITFNKTINCPHCATRGFFITKQENKNED